MNSLEPPGNGQSASDHRNEVPPGDQSVADFSQLRTLLFGPDQVELRRIQKRLDDPKLHAEDVSRILPEAIALRPHPDTGLAQALAPTLQESFKISIKKDPQTLVDVISPIMGPAIRKSISDALQRMIQSLNQTLEYGFSPKAFKWRLEAFRTGKSFAEVVLLNTLQFRVEQVFLIHRNTGLLLQHVSADSEAGADADTVSGMLTAIQDFVRDSFGGAQGESLDQARVGELALWVEQSPHIILAAVVRGNALQTLRSTLQETNEKIQLELRGQLEEFSGDAAPFELSRPYLEACLIRAQRERQMPVAESHGKKSPAPWIIAAMLMGALGTWLYLSYRANHRWTAYLEHLSAEPGIVLTGSGTQHGRWYVNGLRDPMAIDPNTLATASGVDPRLISSRWEPYCSFAPNFALTRARAVLNPPGGVTFRMENGILHASGSATGGWIADARRLTPLVPGVSRFSDDGLIQTDRPAKILHDAVTIMKPPSEVSLGFSDGVITASGTATHDWVGTARKLALSVPGVVAYDDERLVDIEIRDWMAEVNRIESMTVEFATARSEILPVHDRVLMEVADAIRKIGRLATKRGTHFQVVISSHGIVSENPQDLSRRRAERMKAELVYRGVQADLLIADTRSDVEAQVDGGYVSFKVVDSNAASGVKHSQ